MGCSLACWALSGGSPHCITVEGSWSQPPLVVWWVLFCLEISPLKKKKTTLLLSAPQRPIATHRTTATPKAGPGVVRKNPGVGNGDDEAAELMQQVGTSCVQDRSCLGGKGACCPDQGGLSMFLWEDMPCLRTKAVLVTRVSALELVGTASLEVTMEERGARHF